MRCSTFVKMKDFRQLIPKQKDMMWHHFILFHYFGGEITKLQESKIYGLAEISWETL